ncbi:unnamed protein product [Polarella glacialis]|uniref:Uncharacterized protein n=2 Tax=Polarella glacialis TaxID=89957 RepID=A0A813JQS7_POLGL|nr:unnamed protein product [Polarella glacialis]
MLTAHERVQLKTLGYWPDEVDDMRLEVAARVLEKRTARPFGERPMPSAWRRSSSDRGTGSSSRVFRGFAVLALALAAGWATNGWLPQPLRRSFGALSGLSRKASDFPRPSSQRRGRLSMR